MYIQGKSKETLKVTMDSARYISLIICSVLLGVIAIGILGFVLWADILDDALPILLIALLVGEMAASCLMNAVAIKAVKFIIYDEGIYGTAAKINPLSGLFTKTQAFDVPFSDITGMRTEGGALLIQTKYNEYSFTFSQYETSKILSLLGEEVS